MDNEFIVVTDLLSNAKLEALHDEGEVKKYNVNYLIIKLCHARQVYRTCTKYS
jgi:hypothetical protein